MRRLRARLHGDSGFGLPELLVSMSIGSVLLLALGTTFAGTLRTSSVARSRVADTAEVRSALDVMSRRLRLAVRPSTGLAAFEVAEPRQVRFYASLGAGVAEPAPTLVEYAVVSVPSGRCLQERLTTPTATANPAAPWSWTPGASTRTTCLARGSVNPGSARLFRFYATGALGAPPLADTLTGSALDGIGSVELSTSVRPSPTSTVPVTSASTRVSLVNLLPAS